MRVRLWFVSQISLFFLCSILCISSCPAQGSSGASWKEEVERVLASQAEAWNAGNIEGYMEGYWKSDSLLFTSGGTIRRGWNATLAKYKSSYASKDLMGTLEFSGLEINQLSPGAAWVFGRWRLHRRGESPGGVFTLIFRNIEGGWKIVHDHTSSDPS